MNMSDFERIKTLEHCVIELQMKVFPERFKSDETKK